MAKEEMPAVAENEARQAAQGPVYGRRAVEVLLKSGRAVDTLLLAEGLDAKAAGYLSALAKQAGAVVKRSRAEKLAALCGTESHGGVAAFAAEVEYRSLDELLAAAAERGEAPFLLLADGVEDPHNLGALMRTALLCGVHGVVIPRRGAAAVTPAAIKASAGAAALLPVARVANIGEAVRTLKSKNVFVYCAGAQGVPLGRCNLSGPVALVMGAEGKGVSALVRKLCDGEVSLPMVSAPGVDSFNVSVAGGILMYDIYRKRQAE